MIYNHRSSKTAPKNCSLRRSPQSYLFLQSEMTHVSGPEWYNILITVKEIIIYKMYVFNKTSKQDFKHNR